VEITYVTSLNRWIAVPLKGGNVVGTGTLNAIPRTTSATGPVYGDSAITDDGSTVTSTRPYIAPAATTSIPSVRMPHGTAPTSPTNGDLWTTTGGVYARVNGVTKQLDSSGSGMAGTLADNQVAFGSGTDTIAGEAAFTYDDTANTLAITSGSIEVDSGSTTARVILIDDTATDAAIFADADSGSISADLVNETSNWAARFEYGTDWVQLLALGSAPITIETNGDISANDISGATISGTDFTFNGQPGIDTSFTVGGTTYSVSKGGIYAAV
jgi:hypothetical protein